MTVNIFVHLLKIGAMPTAVNYALLESALTTLEVVKKLLTYRKSRIFPGKYIL
ncbi:hypothetical protein GTQ43_21835 [Nostoc sp. KVJ3]|uniref:hypothetical protein n=1 Tax=Nostoc sp. KVJ3 TaxID=457945 RepID=UPI002237FB85|nr:hypothetical protein [Nostoc sp. KVJ3]MCW5316363.1 hypothetical protein [Nostoc sp. KVJ3]